MFHLILIIMLVCDLLSLTTMSSSTTIEHVEAVYDRDWTPGFVIIVTGVQSRRVHVVHIVISTGLPVPCLISSKNDFTCLFSDLFYP